MNILDKKAKFVSGQGLVMRDIAKKLPKHERKLKFLEHKAYSTHKDPDSAERMITNTLRSHEHSKERALHKAKM